jgi:zinc-binding alcohol dehydrogenase family protein
VSRKPVSLSFAAAAALPLTTITAWESLFERFSLNAESTGDLLVLGAAGGVGSIMIQLAKALTKVRVIATASRDESRDWAIQLGADAVIDHHNLVDEATHVAPNGIDYLFTPQTQGNGENFVKILRPFGQITAIDDPTDLDVTSLKAKSISWHWEFMFTRPLYGYDMVAQQRLLARTAELVDSAVLRTTVTTTIEDFSAVGIRQAHSEIESGHAVGKVVVTR